MLTRDARRLADRLGWSRSWVGGILLATATSLPELITGISAVSLANAPNIAVGDVLGSCIFNLVLLALLDVLCREDSAFSRADEGHVLTASLGIMMLAMTGAGLLTSEAGFDPVVGHVSVYTLLLLTIYIVVVRAIFMHERRTRFRVVRALDRPAALRPAVSMTIAAAIIAVAGTWLPFTGAAIAQQTGWGTSFVGTLFIAAATSFPELVVMISALRLRSVDMAIAGLLGSNVFDIAILAVDDFAYTRGSLFADVSAAHAGTAFGAIIMSSVVVAAIIDRPRVRIFGRVGWVSVLLAAIYAISAYWTYLVG